MKIVEINEKKYIIDPFGGIKGLKLKQRLIKTLAPAFKSFKAEETTEDQSFGFIIDAIEHVIENSTDDEIFNILVDLMTGVKTENGNINFDEEFKKNYSTLYKLAKEVIVENYSDVFQALGMNVV